jgi:hypothetical protein
VTSTHYFPIQSELLHIAATIEPEAESSDAINLYAFWKWVFTTLVQWDPGPMSVIDRESRIPT